MKPYLIVILVLLVALIWWRHEEAQDDVDAVQNNSLQKAHEFQLLMGYEKPIYVISAKGKTWASKQRPVITDTDTTFVDSNTGETVCIPGPAFVKEE